VNDIRERISVSLNVSSEFGAHTPSVNSTKRTKGTPASCPTPVILSSEESKLAANRRVAEVPAFAKRAADWQKQVGEGSAFAH